MTWNTNRTAPGFFPEYTSTEGKFSFHIRTTMLGNYFIATRAIIEKTSNSTSYCFVDSPRFCSLELAKHWCKMQMAG